MMQVLAGRAHTIHEVYRGGDNWQMPQLDRPQVEQSKEEVLSWRISHAGTWEEQTLPPLTIGFNLRRKIKGQDRVAFLRLRLVLVKASKIPSARIHIPQLEHIAQRAYNTRHRLTLPDQRTRARKRCPRSCQNHCSTCLGNVTCPSPCCTHHRESGLTQGPCYATEVL